MQRERERVVLSTLGGMAKMDVKIWEDGEASFAPKRSQVNEETDSFPASILSLSLSNLPQKKEKAGTTG